MHLGEYIRQYRDLHKMTVREFAKRSGLSPGYISMLENNRNPKNNEPIIPSIETFQKVAIGMGITVHEIMRHVDENQPVALEYVMSYEEREDVKFNARNMLSSGNSTPLESKEYYLEIFRAFFARSFENCNYNLRHVDFDSYVAMLLNQSEITNEIEKNVLNSLEDEYGRLDGSQYGLLNGKTYFEIPKIKGFYSTISDANDYLLKNTGIPIPIYGCIPAGIPLEAIECIEGYEEIPKEWTDGGKEYFGLRVKGTSMYPKYMDGDLIILRKQSDCESGQDAAVRVNGDDATLKKVIKQQFGIILQPINSEYEPRMYDYNDESNPIEIMGVVVQLRRDV